MKYKIENIKFEQWRHGLFEPGSEEEKLVWKTLDEIDQMLTVLAAVVTSGKPVPDEFLAEVPPSPTVTRKELAKTFWAYIDNTTELIKELQEVGIAPEDALVELPDFMQADGSMDRAALRD